jgi:hypothetical protein
MHEKSKKELDCDFCAKQWSDAFILGCFFVSSQITDCIASTVALGPPG